MVVDVVTVEVVVVAAAAAGGHLLCSAADPAPGGGGLVSDGAAIAGGRGGGSCLLPPAAGDGQLRPGAGAGAAVSVLDGCLAAAGAAAGLTDAGLGEGEPSGERRPCWRGYTFKPEAPRRKQGQRRV